MAETQGDTTGNVAGSDPNGDETSEGAWHTVAQGESTTRLAYDHGLFWKTVWDHPNNDSLKHLRKNQNILNAGDRIFLPALRLKHQSGATEKRHRFKLKGVPEKLNVQFLDLQGKPFASKPYKLKIDGRATRGSLDGDGWLRVPIPPNASHAHIEVGDAGECASVDMDIGHLDPLSELTGVQARLRNLGLYDGPLDAQPSENLDHAVAEFRSQNGLQPGTEIDDTFRDKLKSIHGC